MTFVAGVKQTSNTAVESQKPEAVVEHRATSSHQQRLTPMDVMDGWMDDGTSFDR